MLDAGANRAEHHHKSLIYNLIESKVMQKNSKQQNPVNKIAEKFICWWAKENNNTDKFASMYGLPWAMLMLVGLWASYNSAECDYSVLYGYHYATTNDPDASHVFALLRAAFIQACILVPVGVLGKILVNKLFFISSESDDPTLSDKRFANLNRKHIIQIGFLVPVLVFGLSWNIKLSLDMKTAVRAKADTEIKSKISGYESHVQQVDSLTQNNVQRNQSVFALDSAAVVAQYRAAIDAKTTKLRSEIDEMQRSRNSVLRNIHERSESEIAYAKNILYSYIPARKAKIERIEKQQRLLMQNDIYKLRKNAATLLSADNRKLTAKSDYLDSLKRSEIVLIEENLRKTARNETANSILYSLLAILVTIGLQEVYKRINAQLKAQDDDGKTAATSGKKAQKKPVRATVAASMPKSTAPIVSQEFPIDAAQAESDDPAQIKVIESRYHKLRHDILTYYPRCHPKTRRNPKGSSRESTQINNREKVAAWCDELRSYGYGVTINFDNYTPSRIKMTRPKNIKK